MKNKIKFYLSPIFGIMVMRVGRIEIHSHFQNDCKEARAYLRNRAKEAGYIY